MIMKLIWLETLLHLSLTSQKIIDDLQGELLEIKNDSSAYGFFLEKPLSQFWVSMQWSYAKINVAAFKVINFFVSTYVNVGFLH